MVTKWLKSARNLETRPESPYWPNLYILVQYQSLQNKIEEVRIPPFLPRPLRETRIEIL